MSYLKHKPGSIEELMANEASKLNDNAYQDMFKKELDKAGKGIGGMSPKEKKDFFNKIDSKYKAKNEMNEARFEVEGRVDYKGVSGDDNFTIVIDAKNEKDAEDKVSDMLFKHRNQRKIGPNGGRGVDDYEIESVTRTSKSVTNKFSTYQAAEYKVEEVQESASQVQVKRDGKGNFNLMLRGKEIGYYHKSGSKYMVYYDKDGDDYDQSDEVSSEMQAKKLAYDNMNEVKVDELTKAQEKLPPALQKAIKDKETKKEGFASDAQRKAAFASGYKEKDKKEETIKKEGGPGSGPQGGDSYKTGHKKSVMKPGAGKRPGSAKDGGQTDKEADDYDNEMGEALGKEDDSIVKAVVSQLKKAVKAHDGQAKDLEKAMKNEADQHGDEINDKKKEASKKGEKEPKKLNADTGTKLTKVETEPSVDYKN